MRKLTILFLFVAVSILITGCSRFEADKPVAKISSDTITEQDFVNEYMRHITVTDIQHRMRMETEEDANTFLDYMIGARVIYLEAIDQGFDKRILIQQALKEYSDEQLVKLLEKEKTKEISISDQELKQYHDNMSVDVNVKMILLADEPAAKKVFEEAKAPGADFAVLAKKYSQDAYSKENNGSVPTLRFYPSEPWISIYAAAPGSIIGPIAMPGNAGKYAIFQIVDKVSANVSRPVSWAHQMKMDSWSSLGHKLETRDPIPPFDQMKDDLRNQVMQVRKNEAMEKYKNELIIKYPLERKQDVLDIVYKGDPAEWRKQENRDKVVAVVAGQPIYFKTWFEGALLMGDLPLMRKDNPQFFNETMEGRLRAFWKLQACVAEAIALGLDKTPEYMEMVQRNRMRMLGETYIDEVLSKKLQHPTAQQITDYYERNKEKDAELQSPEMLNIYMIMCDDRATAEQLRAEADKGTKLEDIARRKPGSGRAVVIAKNDETIKDFYAALEKAGVGNISEIQQIDKNFFFGRYDSKTAAKPIQLQGYVDAYLFTANDKPTATMVRERLRGNPKPELALAAETKLSTGLVGQAMRLTEGDPKTGSMFIKIAAGEKGKPTEVWEENGKYYVAIATGEVTQGVWLLIDKKLFGEYCATDDADRIIRDEIQLLKDKHQVNTKEFEGNLRQAFKHLRSVASVEAPAEKTASRP